MTGNIFLMWLFRFLLRCSKNDLNLNLGHLTLGLVDVRHPHAPHLPLCHHSHQVNVMFEISAKYGNSEIILKLFSNQGRKVLKKRGNFSFLGGPTTYRSVRNNFFSFWGDFERLGGWMGKSNIC